VEGGGSMKGKGTTHKENLTALKRIEGQVKGIQRMIEEEKYCVDIVNQVHAAIQAMHRVSEKIFQAHLEHCVIDALKNKSEKEKSIKIDEVMKIIRRIHKL
jgi:DNA-binding FrmR family transcriptional regulator